MINAGVRFAAFHLQSCKNHKLNDRQKCPETHNHRALVLDLGAVIDVSNLVNHVDQAYCERIINSVEWEVIQHLKKEEVVICQSDIGVFASDLVRVKGAKTNVCFVHRQNRVEKGKEEAHEAKNEAWREEDEHSLDYRVLL